MIALVAAGTLNYYYLKYNFNELVFKWNLIKFIYKFTSSAANLRTAVNGVLSGTLKLNKIYINVIPSFQLRCRFFVVINKKRRITLKVKFITLYMITLDLRLMLF
jgi:hypothetical protein